MIQYLIAGLVGGAVAMAQKPKKKGRRKYAEGGVNDGSDETLFVKEDDGSIEIYIFKNANGNYTWRILEDGEIQEQGSEHTKAEAAHACIEALGFYRVRYAKGGRLRNIEGGRIILQQSRSFNTYAEPVSDEVEQSAKEFVYRLDALFEALSLPHVKTYGWNGSSFVAVGSYDIFIEKGDDYDPETGYILGKDYHDAIEEALKFMCDLTGAKLEEYDRESPDTYGSVATIDIDAMVEAHNQEKAKLRERFGFAHGGRVSTYDYEVGGNSKKPFAVLGRKDGMVMYHTSRASIKDSADKAEELLENGYDEVLIAQP